MISNGPAEGRTTRSARILCALRDDAWQEIRDVLSRDGWDLIHAGATSEVGQRLREWPPDVAILDPGLPGPVSTRELLVSIKSHVRSAGVLLLGNPAGEDFAASGTGPDICLELPVLAPALVSTVRLLLRLGEHRRMEKALRDSSAAAEKRWEDELRRGQTEFRLLIENLYSGVAVVDSTGRFTLYNRRFLEMFGLPRDADVQNVNSHNWSAWQVFDEDGQLLDVDEHPVRKAARTGRPVPSRLVGVRAPSGGDLVWMQVSAAPLLGEAGNVEHLICTYHDVTDRMRAEQALRDADRRKNEFLALLSHELRNPLAPITNSLYIMDHAAPGGDDARRAQVIIERQVGQLARLVDDLLDVTRITRNKIRLQCQRLEVNELVRRTLEDYRSQFEEKEIRLEFEPTADPVFVDGDWNRLAQVIGNLLQNAMKFTGRGGEATVSVSLGSAFAGSSEIPEPPGRPEGSSGSSGMPATSGPEGAHVAIRVADNGVGMNAETLARVFEPFMQADTTLDRSKGGLGLGLALVKGLVELHGGAVTGHSAGPGRGAEFVVRLPVLERDAARVEQSRAAARPSSRRILIIEDNVDSAESLRLLLEYSGHEVVTAYNGPDGIARAAEFDPDVVLCDIGLPGMDGYEVARAFRSDPQLRRARLVALSGYALPEDRQRAEEAGFDRHLAKPPQVEELWAVLGLGRL